MTASSSWSLEDSKRFDALDGMRFIAIGLIVFDHMNGLFKVPSIPAIELLGVFVSYFLVLSGFVLAHQYPEFPNFAVWCRYLGARFARLGPLALFGLLLIYALNPYPTFDPAAALPSFIANLFLLQAWIPDKNFYLCFNAPSWTLSVEILLYLILPVCMLAARRRWLFLAACVLISYVSSVLAFNIFNCDMTWSAQIFPPTRLMDFAVGIVTYKLLVKRTQKLTVAKSLLLESLPIIYFAALLAVMMCAGAVKSSQDPKTLFYIFVAGRCFPAAIFSGLIVALVAGKGPLKFITDSQLFKFLSTLSAALYFIHFPIKVHYDIVTQNVPISHPIRLYVLAFLLILTSSYIVSRCLELPLRRQINLSLDKIFERYFPGKTARRWHGSALEEKISLHRISITLLAAVVVSSGLCFYIEHSIVRDKTKLLEVHK